MGRTERVTKLEEEKAGLVLFFTEEREGKAEVWSGNRGGVRYQRCADEAEEVFIRRVNPANWPLVTFEPDVHEL